MPDPSQRDSFSSSRRANQLHQMLDAMPAMVAIVGFDRRYRYVNGQYRQFVGLAEQQILGQTVDHVIGEAAGAQALAAGRRALGGEVVRLEGWVSFPNRGRRFIRAVYTPHRAGSGRIDAYIAFLQDQTERHHTEAALKASEALKAAVIDGAFDCIIGINQAGRIIEFNPAAERTFGHRREAVLGRPMIDVIVPPEHRTECLAGFTRFPDGLRRIIGHRVEVEAIRADDTRIPVELAVSEVMINDQRIFTAYLRDIRQRARFERELAQLAYEDMATGLPNRTQLLKLMVDIDTTSQSFTLLVIDLDRFENIQTSFGQEFTDGLLVGLSSRLRDELSAGDHLARIGDHTFAFLVADTHDAIVIENRVDGISAVLRTATTQTGAAVFLTASIGIATGIPGRSKPHDVLRDAEIAANRARQDGSRHVWFDQSMQDRVVERVRLEHDLRRALESGDELWVAYQPIVELVTGRLAGFEALVRWQHPERGLISPGAFVPIAEETGLIVTLGRWVLGQACRQAGRWQALRQPGAAPLFVSVNLSPRELDEVDCFERWKAIMEICGAEPGWLKVEITESGVMQRPEESLSALHRFKGLGVHLSIDDFGTGYSSLSHLTKLPLNNIKIDRSFVSAMHQSEENRSLVRIIVDLARLLGLDVVAEGIETEADKNLLRALGCDYGQGYFFSKPQPADKAEAFIGGDVPWRDAVDP